MDKTSIKVSTKYTVFADVFLPKFVLKLSKYTSINNHIIQLVDNQ